MSSPGAAASASASSSARPATAAAAAAAAATPSRATAATPSRAAAATPKARTQAAPATPKAAAATPRAAVATPKAAAAPTTPRPLAAIDESEPLSRLAKPQETARTGRSRTPARGTASKAPPTPGRSRTPARLGSPKERQRSKSGKKDKKEKKLKHDKKEKKAKKEKKKKDKEKSKKRKVKLQVRHLFERSHKKGKNEGPGGKHKQENDARKAEKRRKRSSSDGNRSSAASAGGISEEKVKKKKTGRRRWGFRPKENQAATDFNKVKALIREAEREGKPIPPEAKLIKPIVVDELEELREQIRKYQPDYWVSCLAEGAHVSLELALWKMHTDKMLARDCFTHCYLVESEVIKEDANSLIDEFGLGLRTKRVHSNNGPGYVFVLVNEEGVSALAKRNSVLSVTDTRLSTEERLRRSGMLFKQVTLPTLLEKAAEYRGNFWFTTFAKMNAKDCMKRVVAAKFGQRYAVESYDQCYIFEAGNTIVAINKLTSACGYGLRMHSIHATAGPGCLAVLIAKGAKSWAIAPEDEVDPHEALALSRKKPRVWTRRDGGEEKPQKKADDGAKRKPAVSEEARSKPHDEAVNRGLGNADQERLFLADQSASSRLGGILEVEPGAGREKGSKEYEEVRSRQKSEALRKRMWEVAPALSKFQELTMGYLQSRIEQLMGLPAGRLNKHSEEIKEMWPNVLAEYRLGEVWDYLKKKLEVILPTMPKHELTTERVQEKLEEATQRSSGKFDVHRERIRAWLKEKLGEDFEAKPEAEPTLEEEDGLQQGEDRQSEGGEEAREVASGSKAAEEALQAEPPLLGGAQKPQAFVSNSTLLFCVDSESEEEILVDSEAGSEFEFNEDLYKDLAVEGTDPHSPEPDIEPIEPIEPLDDEAKLEAETQRWMQEWLKEKSGEGEDRETRAEDDYMIPEVGPDDEKEDGERPEDEREGEVPREREADVPPAPEPQQPHEQDQGQMQEQEQEKEDQPPAADLMPQAQAGVSGSTELLCVDSDSEDEIVITRGAGAGAELENDKATSSTRAPNSGAAEVVSSSRASRSDATLRASRSNGAQVRSSRRASKPDAAVVVSSRRPSASSDAVQVVASRRASTPNLAQVVPPRKSSRSDATQGLPSRKPSKPKRPHDQEVQGNAGPSINLPRPPAWMVDMLRLAERAK